jgi:rod shape determining protein RodA
LKLNKFTLDKKLLRELDISLLIIPLIISTFGTINIYSATINNANYGSHYFIMQLLCIFFSLVLVYFSLLFDYIYIANYSYIFYWAGVALLLYTDIAGKATKGAQSWIKIFGIQIEPGEIIKIGLILLIAKKIDDMDGDVNKLKNLIQIIFYTAIPVAFIIKEPNYGLAVICLCIVFGMLFISNLDFKIIFGVIILGALSCFLIWNLHLLKGYQIQRITSFLNPSASSSDSTLQVDNSILAIGSGGLWGKGLLHGTQVQGGFIPEAHTDMIFSVVGEEWGLIGAFLLLLLYIVLLIKILKTSRRSKDILGKLICIGFFSALSFSIYQNIGMTIGLAPIAGITLPFMSYGGSSILTNFITMGLILNVSMRKKKINF